MGPRVEALMNQIFKCISVTGRNWNIKHRLCSIVLAAIIWGPYYSVDRGRYCKGKESLLENTQTKHRHCARYLHCTTHSWVWGFGIVLWLRVRSLFLKIPKHHYILITFSAIHYTTPHYTTSPLKPVYTSEFLPLSLSIWFLYFFERGYTSLDWWGQRSNYIWLFGYGNCQMLMSVVRVEVSDIRLILFTLRTFLSFFRCIYCLCFTEA